MNKSNKAKAQSTIVAKARRKGRRNGAMNRQSKSWLPQVAAQLGGSGTGGVGKLAAMMAILRRPKGASIKQLMAATGWQAHSVRGAISGVIKKKRGLTVTSSSTDSGQARVYRIVV